jgi:hypothetical protein
VSDLPTPRSCAARTFTDVSTAFPAVPQSAAAARRYVAAAFRRFVPDDARLDAAVQLASEVVAWASGLGVAPIRLAVAAPDPSVLTVRMTVRRGGALAEMDPTMAELFDSIASEWSLRVDRETTTVTFVMDVGTTPTEVSDDR